MAELKAHLFVCTNCMYTRAEGTFSSPEEAATLRKNLKHRAREHFGKDEVRVTAVNCLGECESGIASVLYPSGEWTLNLTGADEDKMWEKLCREAEKNKTASK